MKKIALFLIVLMVSFTLYGQTTPTFDELEDSFNSFAEDIAPSIPTLANVGLQWSDAWIGYFPHFGIGATMGAAFVPVETFESVLTNLGQDTGMLSDMPSVGIPLPAISGEGRIGGFILPFDIGIKYGAIPASLAAMAGDAIDELDYKMIGFDLRYRLVKEGILIPEVSVGAGYTYLNTKIVMPLGDDQEIGSWDVPIAVDPVTGTVDYDTHTLSFTQPKAEFGWNSSIVDVKAQVSKNVLYLLRPYLGAGISFGFSDVGGGIKSEPYITNENGDDVSIDQVKQAFDDAGMGSEFPDIDEAGITFYGSSNAPSFRLYGGTSISLFLMKLDVSATINPFTKALGAQMNIRLQF